MVRHTHKCQGKNNGGIHNNKGPTILNTETGIPSFETNKGRSWIDLTLCNSKLAQNTRRWTCGEEESCADHKIIFFDIESTGVEGNDTHYYRKRYKTKADNWGTFDHNLVQNIVKNFECETNPNNLKCATKHLAKRSSFVRTQERSYTNIPRQ